MKTRLQLIRGYIDGTLTDKEKSIALANPIVKKAIDKQMIDMAVKSEPEKGDKKVRRKKNA